MKTPFLYILVLISIGSLTISCGNSPKYIEEDELRDIITEAIITDAIILQRGSVDPDSLDYYTTILNRAGYTRQDMEYTIKQMASRKSNPLNNLFDDINKRVTETANAANFRYKRMERFDSAAMAHATDTLYKNDSLIRGTLKNFKLQIPAKQLGKYTLSFDYQSHNSYDTPPRQVITQFTCDTCKTPPAKLKTIMWVNRSFIPREFKQIIEQKNIAYDTLEIKIIEQPLDRKFTAKDTSYIQNIRIYYQPTKEEARRRYLRDLTGLDIPTFEKIDYGQPFTKNSEISSPDSTNAQRQIRP